MKDLLAQLRLDYPAITFVEGEQFCWSPKNQEVIYNKSRLNEPVAAWSLLHEVGHALLGHTDYGNDLALVQMEAAAWHKAREIGQQYGCNIEENHIEDCLDTYRDWLHQRSACPTCGTRSLQQDSRQYKCFNCQNTWEVSSSRFCRPYRMKTKTPLSKAKATSA